MKILPSSGDWALATAIYREFRAKPESASIATRYALAHLSALIGDTRPQRVLEIGAGIGTITKLLLTHPAVVGSLVSTEANEVCRRELAKNIEASGRWRLCRDLNEAAETGAFDLVVLDAEIEAAHCSILRDNAVVFVEGNRRPYRQIMEQYFAEAGKTVAFEQYSPRWQLRKKSRRILGIFPKFKLQRRKGCYVGRVTSLAVK